MSKIKFKVKDIIDIKTIDFKITLVNDYHLVEFHFYL